MENKIIFVNATSATVGGSLTILRQFLEEIKNLKSENSKYYIFVPIDCKINSTEYYNIVPMKAKLYKDRIIWDLFGMKKWSINKGIYPNLIISLQNTAVRFDNINQIIYLHQPLPYSKESNWNPLKSDERKMWFYKYLYKIWIDLSIKKYHKIVVQTKWMKEALINDGYNEDKILVARPTIDNIDIDLDKVKKIACDKFIFYPAADYKYKNHIIIVKAINEIIKNKKLHFENLKIVFTLDKDSSVYKKVLEYKLEKYFEFIGKQKYEDVLLGYFNCQAVVFPSYIETLGLPLLEAASFGKKILVADCEYSREVLSEYELATYIDCKDISKWAEEILELINDYDIYPIENKNNYNGWNDVFDLINKTISLEV